jgi:hypothetical protein
MEMRCGLCYIRKTNPLKLQLSALKRPDFAVPIVPRTAPSHTTQSLLSHALYPVTLHSPCCPMHCTQSQSLLSHALHPISLHSPYCLTYCTQSHYTVPILPHTALMQSNYTVPVVPCTVPSLTTQSLLSHILHPVSLHSPCSPTYCTQSHYTVPVVPCTAPNLTTQSLLSHILHSVSLHSPYSPTYCTHAV